MAVEAVRFVAGLPAPTAQGRVLVADLRTLEVRQEPILRVPACPACAAPPADVDRTP